ncbi:GGDEF domain-containing protein [Pseudorhodoferax sp. Leaf267]|uniref:GGDEF domain-containing protein n=1 Tax=Pseudorhodoferax sp. Leaf267 TaxID=1736316 RepID=UPI0006F31C0C|nr:GGDEF domain-containing protein [Pseudorhodoferax sp. Leaf267]KQP13107.1 hypothetical protein ASF43_18510 [Pseudorhodoferax sp. Leaf267]
MNSVQGLWGLVGAEHLVFSLFWLLLRRALCPSDRAGIYTLALFNLSMGVGLMLIALRGHLPALLTHAGADALIVLALAMMWHGCAAHFGGLATREPLVVGGGTAALLIVLQAAQLADARWRLALVYLAIAWLVVRAPWLASPHGRSRFDHSLDVLMILRTLAVLAALGLVVQALGGLLWGWELAASVAAPQSYLLAYGVLIVLTLLNSALYFIIVRSLVRELGALASRDAMTGLLNRRAFLDRLDRRWQDWQREQRRFVLISVDVDHFKSINDGFGHAAGDAVLCGVAGVLQADARPHDAVARIGGEEFVVILADIADEAQALATAERLRVAVQGMALPPALQGRSVTVSAGVALVAPQDRHPAGTLDRSDRALYRAKGNGRNRVCLDRPHAAA